MGFWDGMIITQQNDTKSNQIGQSKEKLLVLRFPPQLIQIVCVCVCVGGMSLLLVKFYFWYHRT